MKKHHHSVQGTISRLFGKKHSSSSSSNSPTTSLYVTNPPWIFTKEVASDSLARSGDVDGIHYGDNRFGTVTDSGTATLKPRPRVRPLLTFLPLSMRIRRNQDKISQELVLGTWFNVFDKHKAVEKCISIFQNAQEAHGVAVPTPSVPEGFEEKAGPGVGSQINGSYRKYNSVVDLRPKAFEDDYLADDEIPPPPSVPPPPPPPPPPSVPPPPPPSSVGLSPPPASVEAPFPASVEVPPPPSVPPPPPPPAVSAPSFSSLAPPSYPYSNLSSPTTPSPPDFIPPPPPLAFMDGAAPPITPLSPPSPFSNGVSKWKSETVLNLREPEDVSHNPNITVPPSPNQKEKELPQTSPDPHQTFPRSFKIPPPTPVRTSSIPSGDKEPSPRDEQAPKMVSHSQPALPPNFTVRSAAAVHLEGEAGDKVPLEKPMVEKSSVFITESGSPKPTTPESNNSPTSPLKCEVQKELVPHQAILKDSSQKTVTSHAEETQLPSPDWASSDDEDWKERGNLDKLKHELSALLSSSYRKEDRQLEKVPKSKIGITDSNQVSSEELKQAKPTMTSPQSPPAGTNTERREKIPGNTSSEDKVLTNNIKSNPDNKSTSMQANCVLKLKNELEALLSPTKDGGPPLALANLRHNPEPKKQITLQFGGSESKIPKPTVNQHTPISEVAEKESKIPSTPTNNSPSRNICKPPASPLKPKPELLVPAVPSPASSGTASPVRTPSTDLSHLQYKTHRTRLASANGLPSVMSSQTVEDGPITTNNNENQRDSAKHRFSDPPTIIRSTEPSNSNVLIHPVTGEEVEKGSPMALLLAAQQRAQRGRCSGSASWQNSPLSERPQFKLSEKLRNSTQSETMSSTIYYNDTKPNTVKVVPKGLQRESLAVSESKQPNGVSPSENEVWGLSNLGQKEHQPQLLSSTSEQFRDSHKLRESDSQILSPDKCGTSTLVPGSLDSSHLKQQGSSSMSDTRLCSLTNSQIHTSNNGAEEGFSYELIPPPPEFSNDDSGGIDISSKGEEKPKGFSTSVDDQVSDEQVHFNHSSYTYGSSYSPISKPALESSERLSGYSHHYSGGSYPAGYFSSYSNSRPLIKKRLYVSEPDGSYDRPAVSTRSINTPSSYSHNTVTYNSQFMEGMWRNSTHRNSNAQGRRMSLEVPGKMVTYNNAANDTKYKGQNGEYSTSTGRPSHGNLQYGGTANTFTVRPGTRQPISYAYPGLR